MLWWSVKEPLREEEEEEAEAEEEERTGWRCPAAGMWVGGPRSAGRGRGSLPEQEPGGPRPQRSAGAGPAA